MLPFANLGEADHAYFAAGVTEEVTLQLAKVSALRVIGQERDRAVQRPRRAAPGHGARARHRRGAHRQRPPRRLAGARRRAAPRGAQRRDDVERAVRCTVANIFDVQSDIAVRVARALQASLAPEERQRIERVPTANAEAYELYLQQGQLPYGVPAQNQQGIAMLQKAIALDLGSRSAYAMLAQRLCLDRQCARPGRLLTRCRRGAKRGADRSASWRRATTVLVCR